ncbi:MAG: DNA polymerase III subunit beta [Bacteroidales bacterium]|jgi:DNA polymerase-3 subunit beta|nr:DNA polymerase III subunit beta [Bacteroidales bacterium]MDD2570177.1 DNA polymerase III subunit beta [Bacteroidales bacterium]MDD2812972.1 DNA polymerase III subunit beta [Bacteroidales bacterium]MDD3385949.1 DNA polymerase III subunit beta [Bacteroidales bacterium]MDD3811875.1 DNA polymerase III subunit beta [Bacteroidales bacterium]
MKFIISSTDLLSDLQAIARVINTKNTMPILDNFLFKIEGTNLTVTGSDTETTIIASLELESVEGEGIIAIPARLLVDTLKEFPEQPLTFDINLDSLGIDILTDTGKFSIVGKPGIDYPQPKPLEAALITEVTLPADSLNKGISRTLFATADDELRPVMNGILLELRPDHSTFVSSDAHKLVRYRRTDVVSEKEASFILPKKPANLLKSLLPREEGQVNLQFDVKNAIFTLTRHKLICRLIEGNYPAYEAVIPKGNPNKVFADRIAFLNTLRRVSVFSNQASNLVKLQINSNQLTVSAQDIDYSISAVEKLGCQYNGDTMEIGFKSLFLIDILNNIPGDEIILALADPTRAGILLPREEESEEENLLMLLMPMMINT